MTRGRAKDLEDDADGAKQQSLPLAWDAPHQQEAAAAPPGEPAERLAGTGAAASAEAGGTPADGDLAADPSIPPPQEGENAPESAEARVPAEQSARDAGDGPVSVGLAAPAQDGVFRFGEVETTLGQTLMEARGALNLSIVQVAQKTRLPREFIANIEVDDYEALPPYVYTRSYISQLCREYGLASEPLLDRYRAAVGKEVQLPVGRFALGSPDDSGLRLQYQPLGAAETRDGSLLQRLSRRAVVVALLVLVALVLTAFAVQQYKNHQMRRREERLPPSDEVTQTPVAIEDFIIPQQLPLTELPVPE